MDDRTRFDWDYHKNEINKIKHKVSFYEAMTCFFDDNALILYDDNHSAYEDRFILIGMSSESHVLIVCHCFRKNDTIRIISSRKADKHERKKYYNHRR